MRTQSEHERQLCSSPETRAVIWTDGSGRPDEILVVDDIDGDDLAEGIDVSLAAIDHFGKSQGLGRTNTIIQLCENGMVFAGRMPDGRAVSVVTALSANIGLMLTLVRRLIDPQQTGSTASGEATTA